MRAILTVCSLLLFSCQNKSEILKEPLPFVEKYNWKDLELVDTGLASYLEISDNGIINWDNDKVQIMAFDGEDLQLKLNNSSIEIPITPNPNFDNSWKTLSYNQTPTPLIEEQYYALSNYRMMKMLHKKTPTFRAYNLNDSMLNNNTLKNKITVVLISTKNCAACKVEKKSLIKLKDRFSNNQDIQFITLTTDTVWNQDTFPFETFHISDSTLKPISQIGYPTKLVVNKKGYIKHIICGGAENSKHRSIINTINQLKLFK